jgi:Flp pilus assembly protein TadG
MVKRRRERGTDRESGVTVVEFVLLTPILFLLMFATIEFGLVLYARHAAVAAAQEGARTAREERYTNPDGWKQDTKNVTTRWVTSLVGKLVDGGVVNATPTQQGSLTASRFPGAGVTLKFNVVTIVPWQFTVHAESSGPVECFYTPGGLCDGG